jgi:hypothetical protein
MAANAPRTPNRPAGLNRSLLTVIGLLLVLGGAYVLARGLGLLGPDTVGRLGLPEQTSGAPLLPPGVTLQPWVPYVVIVVAAVIGLLCLRWLVAQTGRRASSETWRMSTDRDRGTTRLDTSSAASAFADEIETYTGVGSASAVITGARAQPELHLTLAVEEHASVNELRDRIDTDALPRLRQALELDALPTEILVRLGAKRASNHLQ